MIKEGKLGIFLIAIFLMIATVSAGTVENNYAGPNICKNPGTDTFLGFENGVDWDPITTQYSGVVFSSGTGSGEWVYGEITNWNSPIYWGNGNFWAAYGTLTGDTTGRIDFTNGANYVSVLISGSSPVVMEAYDASGTLLDTAGPTSYNLNTKTMDRLTVEHAGISYVLVHDTGDFWVMDDLCTDATGSLPVPAPEFPTALLPVTMIIGMAGAVFYIQRTREH